MTIWSVAAAGLLLAMVPPAVVIARSGTLDALVALELAGVLTTLVLLLLAQDYGRSALFDLALVAALLSFAGALAFARFLERWV